MWYPYQGVHHRCPPPPPKEAHYMLTALLKLLQAYEAQQTILITLFPSPKPKSGKKLF